MRISGILLASVALVWLIGSHIHAQPTATASTLAQDFVKAGDAQAALAAGQEAAIGNYETALALDPKNPQAYIGLGHVVLKQGLPGKAIHYYASLLAFDPNNKAALLGQGEALIAKSIYTRAKMNLDKLNTLCPSSCPESTQLASDLAAAKTKDPRGYADAEIAAKEKPAEDKDKK
jgi:tetratricopeptide (TPR) repeat protein